MSTVRPRRPLATAATEREAQILPPPWELRPNAVRGCGGAAVAAAEWAACACAKLGSFRRPIGAAVPTKIDKEIGRFFSDAAAESSTTRTLRWGN